jgi:hypothetical protein
VTLFQVTLFYVGLNFVLKERQTNLFAIPAFSRKNVSRFDQGDQIGRFFAHRAIVYIGQFFEKL